MLYRRRGSTRLTSLKVIFELDFFGELKEMFRRLFLLKQFSNQTDLGEKLKQHLNSPSSDSPKSSRYPKLSQTGGKAPSSHLGMNGFADFNLLGSSSKRKAYGSRNLHR